MIDVLLIQSRRVIVSCEMSSETLGKHHEPTPNLLDAPDPYSETQEVGHTTFAVNLLVIFSPNPKDLEGFQSLLFFN